MEIQIPTICPSCSSALEEVNGQLFCRETSCPAQSSKQIENFCKKMKLKGFGPETIRKLELASISDLFYVERLQLDAVVGPKVAEKLENELNEKLRGVTTFESVLGSLGIPLIGEVAARKIALTCNSFADVNVAGKAGENYKTWLNSPEGEETTSLPWNFGELPQTVTNTAVESKNIAVCITGSLVDFKNRDEAANYLNSLGYTVKKSVTKDVKVLICEDYSKVGSSSYKKAESAGIKICTIAELIDSSI